MTGFRRVLSFILALVLLVGAVPAQAFASETEAAVDAGDVTVEGGNALGELISEEITAYQDAQMSAQEEYEPGFSVTELTFSGATATVTYDAMEEATLVVAVYTEDGMTLVNSAYKTVSPGETTASVTLSGEMPEYFYAAAYLLDTYDLSPLCADYSTPLYTKAMQELLASTVNDYPADRVLKLEESNTTNFAVYGEDTVIVEAQAGVNTVASANDETMRYVIENADETFTSLLPGDIVAYEYGDQQYIFAKVDTIDVSGTTVTIQGAEIEVEDVFSHVKLEGASNGEGATVDTSTASEGVRYTPDAEASASSFTDGAFDGTVTKKFPYIIERGVLHAKATMEIKVDFSFLKADDILYTKLALGVGVQLEAEVEGKIPIEPIRLGGWTVPFAYGTMDFVCEPQFIAEISGKINFTASFSGTIGFQYNTLDGFSAIYTTPSLKMELKAEVTVFVGIDMNPKFELFKGLLLEVKASLPVGVEIKAKRALAEAEIGGEERHSCEECLEITADGKVELITGFELFGCIEEQHHVAELKLPIGEAYYSKDHNEFDWGKCPHKSYRVVVSVLDGEGRYVGGASVVVTDSEDYTINETAGAGGLLSLFLPEGAYTFRATHEDLQRTVTQAISEPDKVVIKLPSTPEEEVPEETQGPSFPGGVMGDVESKPVARPQNLRLAMEGVSEAGDRAWYVYESKDKTYSKLVIRGSGDFPNDYEAPIGCYISENGQRHPGMVMPLNTIEVIYEGFSSISDSVTATYVTLPSTIKEIGDYAFYQMDLEEISFPSGLTRIGECAFLGTNIKELSIPDSVQEIGDHAFTACTELENLVIGNGIKELGWTVIDNCTKLKSVVLPSSLENLGEYNFMNCPALQQISLPAGLKIIGQGCFCDSGLRTIAFPSSLKKIGPYAFSNCDYLESVTIPSSVEEVDVGGFGNCDNLKSLLVFGGTEISGSAFSDHKNLERVALGNGITRIGENAFSGCSALKSIQLPNTLEVIGAGAFMRCGLSELTIPGSVRELGSNIIYQCEDLKKLTILPGVENIGEEAFQHCDSLLNVTLPEGLKRIENFAFHNCDSLTEITIPKTVEHIGTHGFGLCYNLETITFAGYDLSDGKDYAIFLGANAFEYCPATKLELPAITDYGTWPFNNCEYIDTIVVDGPVYVNDDRDYGSPFVAAETIYYPYAYSQANLPAEDPEAASYYYTRDRMAKLHYGGTWVPYTVGAGGNMVPMEELAWNPYQDGWNSWPFGGPAETVPSETVVETLPEETAGETIPEETVTETLPAETIAETVPQETVAETIPAETVAETIPPETTAETVPQETIVNVIADAAAETAAETEPEETIAETIPTETVAETEPLTLAGLFLRLPKFLSAAPTALAEEVLELVLPEQTEPAGTDVMETTPVETVVMETEPTETVVMETTPEETLEATVPDYDMVFGGEYGAEDLGEYILTTASFSGLVPGGQYVLLALTSLENPLGNLVHIDQGVASDSGTLSFDYIEGDVTASYVLACGPSDQNLNDATITFPVLYANGEEQLVEPTVVYGGRILEEDRDYTLSGKVSFTESGEYVCYIRGIYDYCGTVQCTYTVQESPYAEPPAVDKPEAESIALYESGTDLSTQKLWVKKLTEDQLGGFSITLTAEVLPADAEQSAAWATSDTTIASVDNGIVCFTGTAGEVTITAETANGLTASVAYRVELPTRMEPEGGTEVCLMAGKATTLKITNTETGKTVAAKDIRWTIADTGVATIATSGKLTAKKLLAKAQTILTAEVYNKGEYVDTVTYTVTVCPAGTQVEILNEDNEVLNGKTISVDTGDGVGAIELSAQVYPLDAMEGVIWKSSSKAVADIDPDTGSLTWKGKTGTTTITATARDGSNKKAAVKLVYGILADNVRIGVKDKKNILEAEEWTLVSGKTLQLAAEVTAHEGKVTNQKLTWTADDPCVKVSASGKVTAQAVYENATATITATAVDSGVVQDTFTVHVQPKDPGMLILRRGDENVTGSTQYVDLESGSTITFMAKYLNSGSWPAVTWKVSNKSVAEVDSGRVTFKKSGSVTITAADAGGKKATVTVKALNLTKTVVITGEAEVASGKSAALKAVNEKGVPVKVDWTIEQGSEYAKLSASGKLTANKDITVARTVTIRATAKDGSKVAGEKEITIRPIAQGVQLLGQGRNLTDSTLEWAMNENETLQLSAVVYPCYDDDGVRNAIQGVAWKSSSAKKATIDENGLLTCHEPGNVTITATAKDGSGKKATVKLQLVKRIESLTMEDQSVTGGKSLNLAKLIRISPAEATNRALLWEITGGDGAQCVTLNAKTGALKTKKVSQLQTVTIRASAQDGSGQTISFTVTVTP